MQRTSDSVHELHVQLLIVFHVHESIILENKTLSIDVNQNKTTQVKTRKNIRNKTSMASKLSPEFAYTVLYVKHVAESVAFYSKAFGYSVRRLDESHRLFYFFSFSSNLISMLRYN